MQCTIPDKPCSIFLFRLASERYTAQSIYCRATHPMTIVTVDIFNGTWVPVELSVTAFRTDCFRLLGLSMVVMVAIW